MATTRASQYLRVALPDGSDEAKEITPAQAKFEQWLDKEDYKLAVDCAPYNGREGGFLGAVDAGGLVADYLVAHPDQMAFMEELVEHACEIGEVSNLWSGDGPDEDVEEFEEEP